jgi:hypothetical protein
VGQEPPFPLASGPTAACLAVVGDTVYTVQEGALIGLQVTNGSVWPRRVLGPAQGSGPCVALDSTRLFFLSGHLFSLGTLSWSPALPAPPSPSFTLAALGGRPALLGLAHQDSCGAEGCSGNTIRGDSQVLLSLGLHYTGRWEYTAHHRLSSF